MVEEMIRKAFHNHCVYRAFHACVLCLIVLGSFERCSTGIWAETPRSGPRIRVGAAQLGAPLTYIPVSDSEDDRFLIQKTIDQTILLTPNESFFPRLGLRSAGRGALAGDSLNGNSSFSRIEGWSPGDVAEWGIWLPRSESVEVRVFMSGTSSGDLYELSVGGRKHQFRPAGSAETSKTVMNCVIDIPRKGQCTVRLECKSAAGKKSTAVALHWIELTGPAIRGGGVIRKRWRPAAAHTKFNSSLAREPIILWIMEMDAQPGELGFYAPVTTPFGYYGPTWSADGRVNKTFNFSLWSFGRKSTLPPMNRLSHLLAVGHPDASFGSFSHEGTGVKVRNWDPLEGRRGQRQTLALRVRPGTPYDTYYSYFYATDEHRWRLFGIGRKFSHGRPLKSLWVGSFVEVPGPPAIQRTGAYPRRMRYRGWVVDAANNLFPIDRMQVGNVSKETGFTHTNRGTTDSKWFFLETGGWKFRRPPEGDTVRLSSPTDAAAVEYLKESDLAFLQSVPVSISGISVDQSGKDAVLTFDVRNLGENGRVEVFWGRKDALTFAEKWDHRKSLRSPKEGRNRVQIEDFMIDDPRFVRLLLTNGDGRFWSFESMTTAK